LVVLQVVQDRKRAVLVLVGANHFLAVREVGGQVASQQLILAQQLMGRLVVVRVGVTLALVVEPQEPLAVLALLVEMETLSTVAKVVVVAQEAIPPQVAPEPPAVFLVAGVERALVEPT